MRKRTNSWYDEHYINNGRDYKRGKYGDYGNDSKNNGDDPDDLKARLELMSSENLEYLYQIVKNERSRRHAGVWCYVISIYRDAGRVYYYIGKSNQVSDRIREHNDGIGAEWTKYHVWGDGTVWELIEVVPCCEFTEDNLTKKYMRKYGIEYVRGGSYSEVNLPQSKIDVLCVELATAGDACFKCGRKGHFKTQCDGNRMAKW